MTFFNSRAFEIEWNDMNKIIAAKLKTGMDAQGFPVISAWENAQLVAFCEDWRDQDADPERETCVRLLWSPEYLFFRYQCRYREIFVYPGGNERRDELWM